MSLKACPRCGLPRPNLKTPCTACAHVNTGQRGSTSQWRATRARVLQRDGHTCQLCGAPANTADHIVPKASGGSDDASNLRAACTPCNSGRRD